MLDFNRPQDNFKIIIFIIIIIIIIIEHYILFLHTAIKNYKLQLLGLLDLVEIYKITNQIVRNKFIF